MASGVNGDHLEDAQSPVQEEWRQEQGDVIAQDLLMEDCVGQSHDSMNCNEDVECLG